MAVRAVRPAATRERLPAPGLDRRLVGRAVALGVAVGLLGFMLTRSFNLTDGDAYWNAAVRLRDGFPLYPSLANQDLPTTYRYAPWLAWLWIPITFLPHGVAGILWQAFLFVCAAIASVPAIRRGEWLLAAICGSMLAWAAQGGNVQAALVAMLVYSVGTRWGPVAIGVAASLKIFPIGYAAVYVARREWGKALVAAGVALALWAPALMYGVGAYPSDVGHPPNLWSIHPIFWIGASVVAFMFLMRDRTWWSGSVFVVLGTVRFIAYDLGYLLVGQDRPTWHWTAPQRLTAWRSTRHPVLEPVSMAGPVRAAMVVAEPVEARDGRTGP